MPRRRGAQPGNLNALKHGFYSRRFRRGEISDLNAILQGDLSDEINMLRVIMRRLFDLASNDPGDIDTMAKAIATLGDASTRLATLLRTQAVIAQRADDIAAALTAALKEVTADMAIQK